MLQSVLGQHTLQPVLNGKKKKTVLFLSLTLVLNTVGPKNVVPLRTVPHTLVKGNQTSAFPKSLGEMVYQTRFKNQEEGKCCID